MISTRYSPTHPDKMRREAIAERRSENSLSRKRNVIVIYKESKIM